MSASVVRRSDVAELAELLTLVRDERSALLPWPFLQRLQALLGCELLSFVGQDSREQLAYFDQTVVDGAQVDAGSGTDSPDLAPFWHHYWDSSCSYPELTRDYTSITSISDFHSARQWHDSGMYVDYDRQFGVEHELMMCVPDGPHRSVRLLCCRGRGTDFGERERFLVSLLRPHVAEAYRAAVHRGSAPPPLTPRQIEILELVRDGHTNRQVGRRLGLAEGTVRTHLNHIFDRLEVTSRTAAVTRGLPDPFTTQAG